MKKYEVKFNTPLRIIEVVKIDSINRAEAMQFALAYLITKVLNAGDMVTAGLLVDEMSSISIHEVK